MSTTRRIRRTQAQVIADLEARLQQLKSKKPVQESAELSIESPGMSELVASFNSALKANKVKGSELIMALARIKRARVKITPTAGE